MKPCCMSLTAPAYTCKGPKRRLGVVDTITMRRTLMGIDVANVEPKPPIRLNSWQIRLP